MGIFTTRRDRMKDAEEWCSRSRPSAAQRWHRPRGRARRASHRSQAVNCNGTLKIGLITPLTGGAGFLGQEQLSWTQYAISTLARPLGLKVQLVRGDTPVEKGPGEGLVVAQKMIADSRLVAVIGPATSGAVASASNALFAAGHRAHLAVRDADLAHVRGRTRRRRRRSSGSCRATTSRARPTRTSWSTSSTRRRSC